MRVHVFIATTEGPVRIQKVQRDPLPETDPRCDTHMTIKGQDHVTFHPDYVFFVNLVIRRLFGHRQFISSVEKDITLGKSWQLAVLLAHAVEADGKCGLVEEEEALEGDWVVLATGMVNGYLKIEPVDDIVVKFKEARKHLDSWLDAGSRVAVVLPKGNRDDVPPEFSSYRRNGNRLTLVDSDKVADLLSQLHHSGLFDGTVAAAAAAAETELMAGVSHGIRTVPAPRPPTRRGWKGVWWMTAGVFCLVAVLMYNESMPGSMRGAIGVGRDLGAWIMTEAMKLMEFEATDDSPEKSRDETAMVPKVVLPDPDDNPDRIPTRDISEYLKLLEAVPPPPRIVVEERGDARFSLLVLPFSANGSLQGDVTGSIWQRTTSIVEEKLRHAGMRPENNDMLPRMPQPDMDKEQVFHLARRTFARYAILLELDHHRRDYPTGNRIHVRLAASLIELDGSEDDPVQMEEPDWTAIPFQCNAQCENRAIDRVVDRAAERIAGKIRARLSRRDSNMTAYNYKLSLCGLTREERAGIESGLLQMSGYVSHLPLFTDNTRAEWKYMSRFGAEELVRKLDATIENEGLEVDVVPLSNGNSFPEYLSDMGRENRIPCDI